MPEAGFFCAVQGCTSAVGAGAAKACYPVALPPKQQQRQQHPCQQQNSLTPAQMALYPMPSPAKSAHAPKVCKSSRRNQNRAGTDRAMGMAKCRIINSGKLISPVRIGNRLLRKLCCSVTLKYSPKVPRLSGRLENCSCLFGNPLVSLSPSVAGENSHK